MSIIIIITYYHSNQDDDNCDNCFGWLKWCNLFLYIYIYPFPPFKISLLFPTSLRSLAHTAHADLVLDFPFTFPYFLNIYLSSARVVGFHHFTLSRLQPIK